jgi:hypothetical protein
MLFQQTSAPTGWTKSTSHNNKALRVVTGTVSSGGNSTFTTIFANRTTSSTSAGGSIGNTTAGGSIGNTTAGGSVGNRTLSTANMPSHNHVDGFAGLNSTASFGVSTVGSNGNVNSQNGISRFNHANTSSTGSSSSHNHSFSGSAHNHSFSGSAHNHSFSGSSHSHTLDMRVQYVDLIIATKD